MKKEMMPRDKLMMYGPTALSKKELFSVILGVGNRNEDVFTISDRMSKELKTGELRDATPDYIGKNYRIGKSGACKLIAALELSERLQEKRKDITKISGPSDVYDILKYRIKDQEQEHLICIFLDTKNRIIKTEEVFRGTLNMLIIHPREIIKKAIRNCSAGIIISHNHPSGDTSPSEEDIRMTEQLKKACDIVGIPLLDHVIIGDGYYSLHQEGNV